MHKDNVKFADSQRFDFPVTLLKGTNPQPIGQTTFRELITQMLRPDKRAGTVRLRELKATNVEAYNNAKDGLPGFIPGLWGRRNDAPENCQNYVPVLVADFDGIQPGQAASYLDKLRTDPYVLAAFLSPGGGLRCLVDTDATFEAHRTAYAQILRHLSECTGLPIGRANDTGAGHLDEATANPSRHWYIVEGLEPDEIYLNPDSLVFHFNNSPQLAPQPSPPTLPPHPAKVQQSQDDANVLLPSDRWALYEQMTDERRSPTAHAGRNGRVLFLAQLAHEHGESEADILGYCLQYTEPGFEEKEIRTTVASALKRTAGGKFNPEKLAHYAAKRNNNAKASKTKVESRSDNRANNSDEPNNTYNAAMRFLSNRWEFHYDIVANELEYRAKGGGKWDILNENNLLHELRKAGHKISDSVLMSMLNSDFVPRYDPFLAYFEGLPQYNPADGSQIEKLAGFVTLADEEKDREWFNRMFCKALVRMAANAALIIKFNKQCVVLKSGQNDGKSTFIRWLCPPSLTRYRADWTRNEVAEKDGRFALAQNLLINLDELSYFGKENIEQTKALMSLDHVKDRPPYGRKPMRFSRRATFFGSTNRDEFLTDESGSVRWLIFEIAGIQHDKGGPNGYGAKVDIDRVWAEAWYLLKTGKIEPEMTKEEVAESESRNRTYQVTTAEREMVIKYLLPASDSITGAEFMTVTDMTTHLQRLTSLRLNKNQVGAAIKLLGWKISQIHKREEGYQVKGFWVLKRAFTESGY